MKAQTRSNRKRILIYAMSTTVITISTYCLLLPLGQKLQLFCVLDDAHIAQEPPIWIPGYWRTPYTEYVNGYWTSPRSGSNLTVITIYEAIDAGTWVYYSTTEDRFWIGHQLGPLKSAFYGPYEGTLWKLTNAISLLAVTCVILSTMGLLYPLMLRALRKEPKTPSNVARINQT